jgi:hypothetical protein
MVTEGGDYSNQANWNMVDDYYNSHNKKFAGRYLQFSKTYTDHRCLSVHEAQSHAAHDVDLISWWENSPDHVGSHTEQRALDGRQAGIDDAKRAFLIHSEVFGAPHALVLFTVDCNPTGSRILPYMDGACSEIGVERVGIYGPHGVVKAALDAGVASVACQCWGWSQGNWDPRAQIHQCGESPRVFYVGSMQCDRLQAFTPKFGQWRYGGAPVPTPVPTPIPVPTPTPGIFRPRPDLTLLMYPATACVLSDATATHPATPSRVVKIVKGQHGKTWLRDVVDPLPGSPVTADRFPVRWFQRQWNATHPKHKIAEDAMFGFDSSIAAGLWQGEYGLLQDRKVGRNTWGHIVIS